MSSSLVFCLTDWSQREATFRYLMDVQWWSCTPLRCGDNMQRLCEQLPPFCMHATGE